MSLIFLYACALGVSCTEPPPKKESASVQETKPPLVRVNEDRKDLLYRYRTDGGFAQATTIAEIPKAVREHVQVVDLSAAPKKRGAARYVQIFDLRTPSSSGQYDGRLVPRAELEANLRAKAKPPKQNPIIMYSTAWCGVCTKARQFMQSKNLLFVEKDIEKDKKAAAELAMKSRNAGLKGGGVPVFDIGGKMIGGFDPGAVVKLARPGGG